MSNVYTALYAICAVSRVLLHSAFSDENHMLNGGGRLISPAPETQRPQAFSSPSSLTLCADEPESLKSCLRGLAWQPRAVYFPVCLSPDWTFFVRNAWNPDLET